LELARPVLILTSRNHVSSQYGRRVTSNLKQPGWFRFCVIALLFAGITLSDTPAQQRVVPLLPSAPRSSVECDNYYSSCLARLKELRTEYTNSERQILNNCGMNTNCFIRENCKHCWPEHTPCGDVFYQFTRLRGLAIDIACLDKAMYEGTAQCRAQVRAYQGTQAKAPAPRNAQEASSEIGISISKKGFETAIDAGNKTLSKDIASAGHTLKGDQLQAYLADARDTQSVLKGMGWMLNGADYAALVAQMYEAKTPEERSQAKVGLGSKFANDIASKGVSVVAEKLFPRAAAVLSGPVGWTVFVGSVVVTPIETSRDFSEIINDNSGSTSLEQKQQALFHEWKAYEKHGAIWSVKQKRDLLADTDLVYRQSNSK
jgi:hypothetical protein